MDIIHLSDLHFGNLNQTFNPNSFSRAISSYINDEKINPFIVISGDISFKGKESAYSSAIRFLSDILNDTEISKSNIIICPGNHDIVDKSFESFDTFMYSIRKDNILSFEENHYQIIEHENTIFYVINSSHHLDSNYGLIHRDCFNNSFNDNPNKIKVAVLHHHIINQFDNDKSNLKNAYDLVKYLDTNKFDYILHGHQHTEQNIIIGESSMQLYCVRSGNYKQDGYFNGFNHYNTDTKIAKFLGLEGSGNNITLKEIR